MKQNSSGKKWLLILIVLAFIAGGIGLFFYLPTKPVKPTESTPASEPDSMDAPANTNNDPANNNTDDMDLPDLPPDQRPSGLPQSQPVAPNPSVPDNAAPDRDSGQNAPPQRFQPMDLLREDDDVIPPPPAGMENDSDQPANNGPAGDDLNR